MQVVFDDNDHYDFLTRKNYLYKLKLGPHYVQKKKNMLMICGQEQVHYS